MGPLGKLNGKQRGRWWGKAALAVVVGSLGGHGGSLRRSREGSAWGSTVCGVSGGEPGAQEQQLGDLARKVARGVLARP